MDYRITLMLTGSCTLACDYCYRAVRGTTCMSLETARAAVDWGISQLRGTDGALDLGYFGGEPLLVFERLRAIHGMVGERCSAAGVPWRAMLSTNGTLIDQPVWSWLRDSGIEVTLSLDGMQVAQDAHRRFPDGKGSWPVLARTLDLIGSDAGLVAINLVLTPEAVTGLADDVECLVERGFRRFSLSPEFSRPWSELDRQVVTRAVERLGDRYIAWIEAETPVFLSFVEEKCRRLLAPHRDAERLCTFGRRELAVSPTGEVYPCERLIGVDASRLNLGHVNDLGSPVGAARLVERVDVLARKRGLPAGCVGCEEVQSCTYFCGCVNHLRTGEIGTPDHLVCFFERLFADTAQRAMTALLHEPGGAACVSVS